MDTDSFIYKIKTEDFYEDMKGMIDYFDTSDFPDTYNIPKVNKKVIGKMKDENNGKIMTEFVGLRSKMYALKVQDRQEQKKYVIKKKSEGIKKYVIKKSKGIKKCVIKKKSKGIKKYVIKKSKGIKKCVIKKRINFNDYIYCLNKKTEQLKRSKKHTEEVNKKLKRRKKHTEEENKTEQYRTMNLIRSKKHELYTQEVNKIALSPHDTKRYILEDGVHTLALGHVSKSNDSS